MTKSRRRGRPPRRTLDRSLPSRSLFHLFTTATGTAKWKQRRELLEYVETAGTANADASDTTPEPAVELIAKDDGTITCSVSYPSTDKTDPVSYPTTWAACELVQQLLVDGQLLLPVPTGSRSRTVVCVTVRPGRHTADEATVTRKLLDLLPKLVANAPQRTPEAVSKRAGCVNIPDTQLASPPVFVSSVPPIEQQADWPHFLFVANESLHDDLLTAAGQAARLRCMQYTGAAVTLLIPLPMIADGCGLRFTIGSGGSLRLALENVSNPSAILAGCNGEFSLHEWVAAALECTPLSIPSSVPGKPLYVLLPLPTYPPERRSGYRQLLARGSGISG